MALAAQEAASVGDALSRVNSDESGVGQHRRDMLLQRCHLLQDVAILARAGEVVVDATKDYGRTNLAAAAPQISGCVPVHCFDTVVEGSASMLLEQIGDEHDFEKLLPRLRVDPEVNAQQFACRDIASRLFKRFPLGSGLWRLAMLDVTPRLRDHQAERTAFFDDEKLSLALDEGAYCQICWQHYWCCLIR